MFEYHNRLPSQQIRKSELFPITYQTGHTYIQNNTNLFHLKYFTQLPQKSFSSATMTSTKKVYIQLAKLFFIHRVVLGTQQFTEGAIAFFCSTELVYTTKESLYKGGQVDYWRKWLVTSLKRQSTLCKAIDPVASYNPSFRYIKRRQN